jgi:hypothetical protein
MNPTTETLPRPEAQKDRTLPAKESPKAETPRSDATPEGHQRFRDWALI